MINIKFLGKRYKIYASGKIKCLDSCDNFVILELQDIIKRIEISYNDPSDGFFVSYMAYKLPQYGVEVISYRDYERENAPPGIVY